MEDEELMRFFKAHMAPTSGRKAQLFVPSARGDEEQRKKLTKMPFQEFGRKQRKKASLRGSVDREEGGLGEQKPSTEISEIAGLLLSVVI